MPNIITHTLFADEVLEKLDIEMFNERKQLFEVGSNGPDFLFFHNQTPKGIFSKTNIRKLGNEVHRHNVNAFYKKSIELIRKEKDESIKKDMITYVCGHLCHWALDSTTHPYVYYKTGEDEIGIWWHHRFESLIDAIMLKVKRDKTINDFNISEILDLSLEQARAMIRIYQPIGKEVFNMDIRPSVYYQCLKDWKLIQNVFYDKNGTKFKVVNKIEKLFNMEMSYSGYLVPNTPEDPFDTMNLLHNKWVHPCDDTIVSTESFFDLFDKALLIAQNVIRLYLSALDDDEYMNDLLHFIDNKNYNLGLNKDLPLKYFDVIY